MTADAITIGLLLIVFGLLLDCWQTAHDEDCEP